MPAVRTVPALPWPTGDTGGTIRFTHPITEYDLLDGSIRFTLEKNDGRIYNVSASRNQTLGLTIQADNAVFLIEPIGHSTNEITLTRINDQQAFLYSLVNVQIAASRLAEVYKDEECTQKPTEGDILEKVYIKVYKPMMAGEGMSFPYGGQFQKLLLIADATPPVTGNQFDIRCWEVFVPTEPLSEGYSGVIELTSENGAQTVGSNPNTEWGWIFE